MNNKYMTCIIECTFCILLIWYGIIIFLQKWLKLVKVISSSVPCKHRIWIQDTSTTFGEISFCEIHLGRYQFVKYIWGDISL
jgi:hypothetical protein